MWLLYSLVIIVIINCAYYLLFLKFSFTSNPKGSTTQLFPVSVIICAKNEAENLKTNIPLWIDQDYPNYEIILINDASSDNTLEVMQSFQHSEKIRIVDVENNEAFWGNKKYALTLGIKKAKNKRILFSDADCQPASTLWIREMASYMSEQKQIVLGYGAYEKRPGILNRFIRFETLMTAIQYFSYAKVGVPYMGVGRNLAYTSKIYYENDGFMSHIKLASGDDDLFVNKAATGQNTVCCYSAPSFTYSIPKKKWKSWFQQKRRHISTAKFYKPQHKMLLGLFYVSNMLFWICSAISFLLLQWEIATAIVVFRILFQWIVIGKASVKLKEKDLIPFIPFLDLFLVLLQLSIFISNTGSKPVRWK